MANEKPQAIITADAQLWDAVLPAVEGLNIPIIYYFQRWWKVLKALDWERVNRFELEGIADWKAVEALKRYLHRQS